ncbi:AbrB family transcriptional regulator [Oceanobacillus sp. CF4.6]|uniref:AbrB family transcriptional regulator n=1 Tax=Oceanobacillus sp. CF4.6 TaxID=3373080 RepID=UPI003EE75223
MSIYSMLKALLIGIAGAILFVAVGLPMPWMLGPLFAVLSVQLFTPISLKWHPVFRNIGLVIAGYVIGYAFTLEALRDMKQYFPVMLLINIVFFILFLLISSLMAYWTKMDRGTAMTCCVPGGLQQIIIFAEEQKNIDLSAVTFYHILRVLMIVTVVPFIVTNDQTSHVQNSVEGVYSVYLIGLLVLCYFTGFLFKKIKIPTAYLLGPVFLMMMFNLGSVEVPFMPSSLLHMAQLVIGIYIGLLLKKENIKLTKKNIFYAFFSSGVLILFALGISILLQRQTALDFSTGFLSVVPGGLDQMGIIAASVKAEVTIVTAFQLFRILFLSVFIIPFVKYVVSKDTKRKRLEN